MVAALVVREFSLCHGGGWGCVCVLRHGSLKIGLARVGGGQRVEVGVQITALAVMLCGLDNRPVCTESYHHWVGCLQSVSRKIASG